MYSFKCLQVKLLKPKVLHNSEFELLIQINDSVSLILD